MALSLSASLVTEYNHLFNTCQINSAQHAEVKTTCDKIVAKKSRYQVVESKTNVPWYIVGIIHCMEGSLSFNTHLHNGDPLSHRTVQVPKGRPIQGNPPFSWEDSAVDALQFDGLANNHNWGLGMTLFKLEGFNGFGYRTKNTGILSPYLWSYSNHYTKGKFTQDHKFDANAKSKQIGAGVLLKELQSRGEVSVSVP